jgi:hypothetical protein
LAASLCRYDIIVWLLFLSFHDRWRRENIRALFRRIFEPRGAGCAFEFLQSLFIFLDLTLLGGPFQSASYGGIPEKFAELKPFITILFSGTLRLI